MNLSAKKFLRGLLDGKWHVYEKMPKGVGICTVESCIDSGFVQTKKVDRSRSGELESYRIALRITRRGRAALKAEFNL